MFKHIYSAIAPAIGVLLIQRYSQAKLEPWECVVMVLLVSPALLAFLNLRESQEVE